MNAVDTNVMVYAMDQDEPVKQAKAQMLLRTLRLASPPTFLLWQVLGETVQQLRRWKDRGKVTSVEFDQYVQATPLYFPLVFPRLVVLDHALDLANRYSLSHWDSMLLGACKAKGITTIYTEDMGSPRQIDTIQLINPFL